MRLASIPFNAARRPVKNPALANPFGSLWESWPNLE